MNLNAFYDTGRNMAEPIVLHSYDNNNYAEVTRSSGERDSIKRGYIYKDEALTKRFGTSVWDALGGNNFQFKSRRSQYNSSSYFVYICDTNYQELPDETVHYGFGKNRKFRTRASLFAAIANFLKANPTFNVLCEGAISAKSVFAYGPAYSAWHDPRIGAVIKSVPRGPGIKRGGKFVRGYGKAPLRNPQFYKK